MFRTKQCHQVHMLMKNVDGGAQLAIYPGRIGDQPYPFPFQQIKVPLPEYFDTCFNLCLDFDTRYCKQCYQQKAYKYPAPIHKG